jgi:hypothetical protein
VVHSGSMPVPPFDFHGLIPPYLGPKPSGPSGLMSPHAATAAEIASSQLASTAWRRDLLFAWLAHRALLRQLGLLGAFQWFDGSFTENKTPKDIDVVTFFFRPIHAQTDAAMLHLMRTESLLSKPAMKAHGLDVHFIDLNAHPASIVAGTAYYNGLFSHSRNADRWKGMLRVPLDDVHGDWAALHILHSARGAP